MTVEERSERNVIGIITNGDRKGSRVVVYPINGAGLHQVIFATGASAWYLPEDIKIIGEVGNG